MGSLSPRFVGAYCPLERGKVNRKLGEKARPLVGRAFFQKGEHAWVPSM